ETERIKSDLEERSQRAADVPRETVVETSAGTVVEKRLNANVMRRRHSEPASSPVTSEPAEPFQFEAAPAETESAFVAPVFDEPPALQAEIPELPVLEPESPAHSTPAAAPDLDDERSTPEPRHESAEGAESTTEGLNATPPEGPHKPTVARDTKP